MLHREEPPRLSTVLYDRSRGAADRLDTHYVMNHTVHLPGGITAATTVDVAVEAGMLDQTSIRVLEWAIEGLVGRLISHISEQEGAL